MASVGSDDVFTGENASFHLRRHRHRNRRSRRRSLSLNSAPAAAPAAKESRWSTSDSRHSSSPRENGRRLTPASAHPPAAPVVVRDLDVSSRHDGGDRVGNYSSPFSEVSVVGAESSGTSSVGETSATSEFGCTWSIVLGNMI